MSPLTAPPTPPLAALVYKILSGGQDAPAAFTADDAQNGWVTAALVQAACSDGEQGLAAFTDGAWLDPARAPEEYLDWQACWRGVDLRGTDDLAVIREWLATGGPTRQRGSDEAIRYRVEQVLTGTKTIRFYPRTDPDNPGVDSPGHTLIRTRTDETPGGEASVIAAARDRAAAVWQKVHSQVFDGIAWDEATGSWDDATGSWEDN